MLRLLCLLFAALTFLSVSQTEAATYYVDQDGLGGSCSNSNPGTLTQPRCTINGGVQLLSSGDTLYIRGATYLNQNIGQYGPTQVPNGRSWETATLIASYPGETAIFQNGGISMINGNSYIIFDRLWMKNGGYWMDSSAHHIRFQNGEISAEEPGYMLIQSQKGSSFFELLNSKIHGAGACRILSPPFVNTGSCAGLEYGTAYYGMYWSGQDSLFDGNLWYDNAGYAVHNFASGQNTTARNVYRNNVFYGNGFDDGDRNQQQWALLIGTGPENKVYNNIFYNNSNGIQVDFRCHNCEVYNNTVYGNTGGGLTVSRSNSVLFANNISFNNSVDYNETQAAGEEHTPATLIGNWFSSDGNPQFVNSSAGNFLSRPARH
jgi:parallel beta-helix repeat protein